MILIKHELKQGWKSLAVWTASIGFFIIICVFLYPEMKGEMEDMNEMFSSMGAFSSAFGMDRLNFGTLIGFYATECGNILGLGGAFFASLIAVSSLAKEEKEHTAEFLFAHPISRKKILTEKLTSVLFQLWSTSPRMRIRSSGPTSTPRQTSPSTSTSTSPLSSRKL